MIWVTDAKALPDYRLWVQFSDGSNGDIDLRELIFSDRRPIILELRDSDKFAAIRVDMDTVVWDNGFDLAPEYLHSRLKERVAA